MGAHNLQAMLDTGLDTDTVLAWHLQHNHYPPVPLSMLDACKAALAAAANDDHDLEINLPDGIMYRGRPTAPAYAIIEQHHLDNFGGF